MVQNKIGVSDSFTIGNFIITQNCDTYNKYHLTLSSDFMTPMIDYTIVSCAILAFFKFFVLDPMLEEVNRCRTFATTLNTAYPHKKHTYTAFQVMMADSLIL